MWRDPQRERFVTAVGRRTRLADYATFEGQEMLLCAPMGAEKVGRNTQKPGTQLSKGRVEALAPPKCDREGLGGEVISDCASHSPREVTMDMLEIRLEESVKDLGVFKPPFRRTCGV